MASAASELCVAAAAAKCLCERQRSNISMLRSAVVGSGATIRQTKEQSLLNSSNNVLATVFFNDENQTESLDIVIFW